MVDVFGIEQVADDRSHVKLVYTFGKTMHLHVPAAFRFERMVE